MSSTAAVDDVNLPWLLAGEIQLPHLLVGGLQVAGKAWRVEQRFGEAVLRQLLPDRRQLAWIARQANGERLVPIEAVGDEFRQADRRQQAGSDPRGEMRALKRDQWDADPKGVARGGVGVVDLRHSPKRKPGK